MNLKKMTVYQSAGNNESVPIMVEEWSFDREKKELTTFNRNSEIVRQSIFQYDKKGRLVALEENFPIEKMTNLSKIEYRDEERQKIERAFYQDGSNSKTVTTYWNEGGKILKIEKYEEETSTVPIEVQTFVYDNFGNLVNKKTMDENEIVIDSKTWTYDGEHLLIRYDSVQDGAENQFQFEYDEKGILKKQISLMNEALTDTLEITYDAAEGTRTEFSTNQNSESFERKYNKQDLLISEERKTLRSENRYKTAKLFITYNEDGLIQSETSLDDFNTDNCYQNRYEYEYYPE